MKAPITTAQAMSHPDVVLTINTLGKMADDLREEVATLKAARVRDQKALNDAATSLETIASLAGRKTYGNPPIDSFMGEFDEVRHYAAARAQAARADIDPARKQETPNDTTK